MNQPINKLMYTPKASTNIFPSLSSVSTADRQFLNGHSGGLLWFTGLSGSGKSTLAHAVEEKLHSLCVRSYVLDGDNIRTGLNKDLGLSPEDRKENIRRIAEVAKLMVDAGLLVFAAFIAPYKQSRKYVRKLMAGWPYYEVYVKCSVEECAKRDPKGLYKKARAGEITNMTGISAPYEEPGHSDLIIETDKLGLQQCVDEVIEFFLKKGLISAVSQPKFEKLGKI
jgi:adenylylsulfate kinase